jgi:hypothetical protein
MKLKLLSIALAFCLAGCVENANKQEISKTEKKPLVVEKPVAAAKATVTKEKAPAVSDVQVKEMHRIMNVITKGNLSGPEELFKIISGQTQTTERELPVPGAVTEAIEKGYRIICYQEGNDNIVAATDPTLIGTPASDHKANDNQVVRNKAIEELKRSKSDEAAFTYVVKKNTETLMVNGKPTTHNRVVVAKGRNSFDFTRSQKKFLCTIGGDIANHY